MSGYQIFIQSIALLALAGFAASYHAKTRRGILFIQVLSLCAWLIHFLLLSAWTGAMLNAINIFITAAFLFKDKKIWVKSNYFFTSAILILTAATAATWQGFFSLFALLGVYLATLARWQDKTKMIRFIAIFSGISWIVYDIFVGSYGGIIAELVIIFSIMLSLMRKKFLMPL